MSEGLCCYCCPTVAAVCVAWASPLVWGCAPVVAYLRHAGWCRDALCPRHAPASRTGLRGNVVPPVRSLRIYSRATHWLSRYVPEALSHRISSRAAHWLRRYVPEALSHRIYSRTVHWLRRYAPEARHFSDILSHSPLAKAVRARGTSLFGNPVRDAGACRDRASPSRQRAGGTPLPTVI